jgi:hypothetical protein
MPNADQQSGGKFAVKMEIKGTLTPPPPPPLPESLGASPFPPLSSTDYGTTTNHPSQEVFLRFEMFY